MPDQFSKINRSINPKTWDISKNNILKNNWWKRFPRIPVFPLIPSVSITMPVDAMVVGSFAELPVTLSAVTFEQVSFRIPEGSKAGQVSVSKTGDSLVPTLILLAGYEAGNYQLEVVKNSDNSVINTFNFVTTTKWNKEEFGPSIHLEGIIKHDFVTGAAWGGGSGAVQNFEITPHSGDWNVCLILVDCEEERYDASEIAAVKTKWMNETIDGATQADGSIRSSKKYYSEISNGDLVLNATIFGPVNLSGSFSDRINVDGSAKGSMTQEAVSAIDSSVDFTQFNSIVFIFRSVLNASDGIGGILPAKRSWAWAWGQTFSTAEGALAKNCLIMPHDWENHPNSGRQIHETLSHELGHNFGMGDLYAPAVTGRNMGSWEPMAFEAGLPSLSLYHLLRQGWVQDTWIKQFDFLNIGTVVNETVTLHPVEAGSPPVGRFSGIEIRIADGWNYYFEYKKGIVGEINSQTLPENRRVLGTDAISGDFSVPYERPGLLLLPNDNDGDGQILGATEDYEETDITDPTFPTDFKISVVSEDGDKAQVLVQYGINSKPDPSIRPWPASADRQWQSPDIEVQNTRSLTNSDWFNTPWLNNDNNVIARVKNSGNLGAPSVRVNFYVKNYNIGGAPEVLIGTQVKDIPAGATVEFNTNWRPPADGHYCIVVRIPLYQVGSSGVVEMTELNNVAQSNYDKFLSGSASPFSREIVELEVGNPYPDQIARVFVIPSQSNPHYRTYLEHTWLYLKPAEVRKVKMMVERIDYQDLPMDYMPYKKLLDQTILPNIQGNNVSELRVKNPINKVGILALVSEGVIDVHHQVHQNLIRLGGVDAIIASGKKTEFQFLEHSKDQNLYGQVIISSSKTGVEGGKVIAKYTMNYKNDEGLQALEYQTMDIIEGGYFRGQPKFKDYEKVQCYYDPFPGLVDCWSKEVS